MLIEFKDGQADPGLNPVPESLDQCLTAELWIGNRSLGRHDGLQFFSNDLLGAALSASIKRESVPVSTLSSADVLDVRPQQGGVAILVAGEEVATASFPEIVHALSIAWTDLLRELFGSGAPRVIVNGPVLLFRSS